MKNLEYSELLREELSSRCKKNPSYSARALARDLGVSPGFLSQIFSGRRLLAEDRAQTIANKLPWPRWKKSVFVKLVHYKTIRDDGLRESAMREVKILLVRANSRAARAKFNQLKLEEFSVVSDWQHAAIYELTSLKSFKADTKWIAAKLGITANEAETALNRLLRVNLLENVNGDLRKAKGDCKVSAVPSAAIRRYHSQHLDKAKRAIEAQPIQKRDFSGTTLAIDIKKLPRAKALIRRFNMELAQLLATGDKSAVYHLAVQFYRLDEQE